MEFVGAARMSAAERIRTYTNGSRNAKCTSSCCFSFRGVSGGGTRPTVCRFSAQRSSHQTHTRVVLSLWQPAHVATDVPVIAFIIHDMCVCYQRGWLHTHTRQAAAYNFSPNCTQKIQFKFHTHRLCCSTSSYCQRIPREFPCR